MLDAVATPSKRIKRLHKKRDNKELSLKDFAVDLSLNGTAEEKRIVEDWFTCKAGEAKPAEPKKAAIPAKLTVEPPKKSAPKKKG